MRDWLVALGVLLVLGGGWVVAILLAPELGRQLAAGLGILGLIVVVLVARTLDGRDWREMRERKARRRRAMD